MSGAGERSQYLFARGKAAPFEEQMLICLEALRG